MSHTNSSPLGKWLASVLGHANQSAVAVILSRLFHHAEILCVCHRNFGCVCVCASMCMTHIHLWVVMGTVLTTRDNNSTKNSLFIIITINIVIAFAMAACMHFHHQICIMHFSMFYFLFSTTIKSLENFPQKLLLCYNGRSAVIQLICKPGLEWSHVRQICSIWIISTCSQFDVKSNLWLERWQIR